MTFFDERTKDVVAVSFAPAFRQTKDGACGAAALAFGLEWLGDPSSEADFYEGTGWMAFSTLEHFARARGFDANGERWSSLQSLSLHAGEIALVEFRGGTHVVAVVFSSRRTFMVFDPSSGRLGEVDKARLSALSSGVILRIHYGLLTFPHG